MFYVKLYVHSLVDKLKLFYENERCYNKIYNLRIIRVQITQHSLSVTTWRNVAQVRDFQIYKHSAPTLRGNEASFFLIMTQSGKLLK